MRVAFTVILLWMVAGAPALALELSAITVTNDEGHDVGLVISSCEGEPLLVGGALHLSRDGGFSYGSDVGHPLLRFGCLVIRRVDLESRR